MIALASTTLYTVNIIETEAYPYLYTNEEECIKKNTSAKSIERMVTELCSSLSYPIQSIPSPIKVGDDALKNFILDERERLRESNLSPEENQKLRIKRAQEREQERKQERKIKENEKRDREAQDALDAECAPAKYYVEEMVKQGRKKGTPDYMSRMYARHYIGASLTSKCGITW